MENRRLLWVAALTLSGALLAGCGDDEPTQEETTSTEMATSQAEPSSDGEPRNVTSSDEEKTSQPGAYSESRPNRESPTPVDVESGTNINTGVGNEGAPEPSYEDEPDANNR